jgi:hypothetical protein
VPLWSALVGVAALVGAYEEAYSASPSEFLSTSPTAATTVLLAAAFGFVAAALLAASVSPGRGGAPDRAPAAEPAAGPAAPHDDESVVA